MAKEPVAHDGDDSLLIDARVPGDVRPAGRVVFELDLSGTEHVQAAGAGDVFAAPRGYAEDPVTRDDVGGRLYTVVRSWLARATDPVPTSSSWPGAAHRWPG